MIRAAARTRRHRPDVADRAGRYLRSRALAGGGFADRAGAADLYYTVFGMQGGRALGTDLPEAALAGYLRSFGSGETLDLVHLACLARCWAMLPAGPLLPEGRRAILARIETHRAGDGGYHPTPGSAAGTAYASFLALGASEDLGAALPEPGGIIACLASLRTEDGAYANTPNLPFGSTAATAAAVVTLEALGEEEDPATTAWLLGQARPDGGFLAMPMAPAPDLLSTAVALHALARAGAPLGPVRRPCLVFVDRLAGDDGGFRGHLADDQADCEYTFYGLLALGHLAG